MNPIANACLKWRVKDKAALTCGSLDGSNSLVLQLVLGLPAELEEEAYALSRF